MPVCAVCRLSAGTASATSTAVGGDGRDERVAQDAVEDRAPEAALAVVAAEPAQERDAALLDPVAEPREHAGSTVSEPIIATATTIIVPTEKDMNVLSPERNMPAIAISTVMPGDEHGAARGGGGGLERGASLRPARALVALTPHVEERVVDADGEPDQEDDLGDRSSIGTIWLGRATRPERGERRR